MFFLLVALALSACKKDTPKLGSGDYLIFGHFHGECMGEECVEMFELTSDELKEDSNDHYGGDGPYNFTSLTAEKFELVAGLAADIPAELIEQPDSTFGCPDCADQGGIYIELKEEGTTHKWTIDKSKTGSPDYLHDFIDLITEKINVINE